MKKSLTIIFILLLMPAAVFAQWSVNFNYGWLDNVSPDWVESDHIGDDTPFSLWGDGWQAGGGLEYRSKNWLAFGISGFYQSFDAQPSGHYDPQGADLFSYTWTGESSWQAPIIGYVRLIKPRSILDTNLKIGLGTMSSHIGQLTVIATGGFAGTTDTTIAAGTGETVSRRFWQINTGIRVPLTARLGLRIEFGYLSTFDKVVRELPLDVGLNIKW